MAFVRSKKVNGKEYFQVVRNYREGGKHKQEMIHHLGPHSTVEEAIEHSRHQLESYLRMAAYFEEEAVITKEYLLDFYGIQIEVDHQEFFHSGDDLLDTWDALGEEVRRVYQKFLEEFGPLEGFVDYEQAKRAVELNKQQADFHRTKLQERLEIKEKYF